MRFFVLFRQLIKGLFRHRVVAACALMFTGSYLDNLRGVILPLVSRELGIPYSASSWLLGLGNIAAVLGVLALLAYLKRWSLKSAIFLGIAGMTAVVVSSLYVRSYPSFLLFAFSLGGMLTALGTMSSLTIMQSIDGPKLASTLSLLHVMYGAGSFLAPAVASGLLTQGWRWTGLMHLSLIGLGLCAVMMLFAVEAQPPRHAAAHVAATSAGPKNGPLQVLLLATFASYVAGEVAGSMWMTAYLVESRHMTVGSAAPYLSAFFIFMAASRTATFFVRSAAVQMYLLVGCLVSALVTFCFGLDGHLWALPLFGLLGPFYPLFMARITRAFAAQWQKMTLWAIISMQLALLVTHWFVGEAATRYGTSVAYIFPAIMIALALALTLVFLRFEGKAIALQGKTTAQLKETI